MLSDSAQKMQDVILKKGLKIKVVELPSSTRTAQEAALAIGCEVAQIVKSLIFRTRQTKRAILVLASGINRVNEKKMTEVVNEPIEKADADFTKEVTGFAIGGIPPFGHKERIETYIDEDLLKFKELWAAAGTSHAVFCLESSLIKELTKGQVISIK